MISAGKNICSKVPQAAKSVVEEFACGGWYKQSANDQCKTAVKDAFSMKPGGDSGCVYEMWQLAGVTDQNAMCEDPAAGNKTQAEFAACTLKSVNEGPYIVGGVAFKNIEEFSKFALQMSESGTSFDDWKGIPPVPKMITNKYKKGENGEDGPLTQLYLQAMSQLPKSKWTDADTQRKLAKHIIKYAKAHKIGKNGAFSDRHVAYAALDKSDNLIVSFAQVPKSLLKNVKDKTQKENLKRLFTESWIIYLNKSGLEPAAAKKEKNNIAKVLKKVTKGVDLSKSVVSDVEIDGKKSVKHIHLNSSTPARLMKNAGGNSAMRRRAIAFLWKEAAGKVGDKLNPKQRRFLADALVAATKKLDLHKLRKASIKEASLDGKGSVTLQFAPEKLVVGDLANKIFARAGFDGSLLVKELYFQWLDKAGDKADKNEIATQVMREALAIMDGHTPGRDSLRALTQANVAKVDGVFALKVEDDAAGKKNYSGSVAITGIYDQTKKGVTLGGEATIKAYDGDKVDVNVNLGISAAAVQSKPGSFDSSLAMEGQMTNEQIDALDRDPAGSSFGLPIANASIGNDQDMWYLFGNFGLNGTYNANLGSNLFGEHAYATAPNGLGLGINGGFRFLKDDALRILYSATYGYRTGSINYLDVEDFAISHDLNFAAAIEGDPIKELTLGLEAYGGKSFELDQSAGGVSLYIKAMPAKWCLLMAAGGYAKTTPKDAMTTETFGISAMAKFPIPQVPGLAPRLKVSWAKTQGSQTVDLAAGTGEPNSEGSNISGGTLPDGNPAPEGPFDIDGSIDNISATIGIEYAVHENVILSGDLGYKRKGLHNGISNKVLDGFALSLSLAIPF